MTGGSGMTLTENGGNSHSDDKIKGVFSTQVVQKVGTGTTTRKSVKKTFWYVNQLDNETIEIQPLNVNYVPSGPKRKVPITEFLEKFAPEPEFYVSNVYPKMKELYDSIKEGEKNREEGDNFSAEFEFVNALGIDEDNVRANFGLGLTYLDRGDDAKANDIFERLVKLDAAFNKEHKHLFNEFGINLRKNKMYDQSVDYYLRAMELTENDENLHYNMARAYFDKEEFVKAGEHLTMALSLKPEFEEAQKFLNYLKKKNYIEDDGQSDTGSANGKEAKPEAESSYDMNV